MCDAFTVMDKDGSRELDKDELEAGLEEVIGIRLNNAEMNVLFYIIDRDGSGTVEYHELMSALRNAPKIVYVTFDEFHEGLAKLGYPLRPGFERKLWSTCHTEQRETWSRQWRWQWCQRQCVVNNRKQW